MMAEQQAFPADEWDFAKEFLLDLARQPDNIRRLAAVIGLAKSAALQEYVAKRLQFDRRPMPCGHAAKYWVPTGDAEAFVAGPEKHGRCVVCEAVRLALAPWNGDMAKAL